MNIRQQLDVLEAAGTSEGAKKAWDTRGRKSGGSEEVKARIEKVKVARGHAIERNDNFDRSSGSANEHIEKGNDSLSRAEAAAKTGDHQLAHQHLDEAEEHYRDAEGSMNAHDEDED